MDTFGDRLKQLRKEKNLTQENLASIFFLNKSSISRYEKNSQIPENDLLQKIADFFDVSTDYLMCRSEVRESADKLIDMKVPKEYTDKYKVTSRDKKQFAEEIRKANEAFFMDDELDESAKKGMLDLISEMFWDAKLKNKRVKKDK